MRKTELWFSPIDLLSFEPTVRLTGTDISCVRGGREVFSGLSFSVGSGEALAVTGPNGSGKSSLLRVAAGLVRLGGGTLALEGGGAELTIHEQAHYVGHLDPVKPSLTVCENLAMWTAFLGDGADRHDVTGKVDVALFRTGLIELTDMPASYLSAGQRRRLSVARLLTVSRPIWLLDEATAPLDARGQEDFAVLMREHLSGGGMIMAATHAPLEIEAARELRLGAREIR